MKSLLTYVIVFVGSFLSAALVIGLLWFAKPQLFGAAGGAPAVHAAGADSVAAPPAGHGPKSLPAGPTLSELRGGDTMPVPRQQPAPPPDTAVRPEVAASPVAAALPDTVSAVRSKDTTASAPSDSARAKDQKAFAKVLEAMQAENAARILKDLPDDEVKRILLNIKKRQAAKILASLDPERAARIMR